MTLTAADLAYMRTVQGQHLPTLATIQDISVTTDELGGQNETWTTRATGVRCRLGLPSSGEPTIVTDRVDTSPRVVITFAWGTDVRPRDRVIIGSTVYTVLSIDGDHDWGTAIRASATPVTG